jgi:3,4-dihydroxy 2-butanone 4-phosphate synthase/GTP cyclohydrolase II
MITHGKGLLCCPISYENAKRLNINLMVNDNEDKLGTAFTHSIDHISCTTGISAIERSITIKALADPNATTYHFRKPGHIFPLIAKDNGVLEREGHTEATIDLAKISGCNQVGLICEIIDEDGAMARLNKLQQIAKQFDLKMIHIKDLITYRKEQEKVIKENKK